MKKYLLLLISCLLLSLSSYGQVQDRFRTKKENENASQQPAASAEKPAAKQKQKGSMSDFWDKTMIGGTVSLSFGSYTFILVSPTLMYKASDLVTVGVGFMYQYAKYNAVYDYNLGGYVRVPDYDYTVWGPKVVGYLFPIEQFYVGSQFEYLNHDFYSINNAGQPVAQNLWTPVWFLEAGLSSPIGQKGMAQIGLRYNVLDDIQSPYASAWFPVISFYF